jgi:hypothetical protein
VLQIGAGGELLPITRMFRSALGVPARDGPSKEKRPTSAAAPTIHQMSLTMTQMISASTTNAPNPPPELAPDLLMPQNVRRPTDTPADAESHCNALRGAMAD